MARKTTADNLLDTSGMLAHHRKRCRRLGAEPVSEQRACELIKELTAIFKAAANDEPQRTH